MKRFTDQPMVRQARLLRHARGLSMEEMAKLCGVTVPTISRFEAGLLMLSLPRLRLYVKHVRSTIDEVLKDVPGSPAPSERATQLVLAG